MINFAGHLSDDWVAAKYCDQSLLGFCLSRCPPGKTQEKINCKHFTVLEEI